MNREQELRHLTAPSSDPKQRMIDYWGHRAEHFEDALRLIANQKGDHWSKGVARRALSCADPVPEQEPPKPNYREQRRR